MPKEPVELDPKKGGKKDAKKKDVKKKDDKKAVKGGKGGKEVEPEKKTVQILDWQVEKRDKVYVNDKDIRIANQNLLLAIKVEIL